MWLCAYLCLRVCAHTRLLCVCLLLLLCLCACGRAGMEHGHFATELNSQKRAWFLACRAVFRLCIYASDNHSNLYHRLVIHVCLLCSALVRLHQEAPLFLSFLLPPKTLPAEMFTPSPVRVSSAAPHRS